MPGENIPSTGLYIVTYMLHVEKENCSVQKKNAPHLHQCYRPFHKNLKYVVVLPCPISQQEKPNCSEAYMPPSHWFKPWTSESTTAMPFCRLCRCMWWGSFRWSRMRWHIQISSNWCRLTSPHWWWGSTGYSSQVNIADLQSLDLLPLNLTTLLDPMLTLVYYVPTWVLSGKAVGADTARQSLLIPYSPMVEHPPEPLKSS